MSLILYDSCSHLPTKSSSKMAEAPLIFITYKRRKLKSKNQNSTENPNNNGVQVEEDRLTSLPDTLLLEILSLLPLKSAAATSVLSHRWRHLWTQLPHLFFDGENPPWEPDNAVTGGREQRFIRFKVTVLHILRQIASPIIQTFNLRLPDPGAKSKLCPATLKSFLRILCTRNVASVKVILDPFSGPTPNVYLPTCIFEIRSLVQLQLGGCIYCILPKTKKGIISLPYLKKLELGNIRLDDLQKLWALINSCPQLEVLYLGLYLSNAGIVNISVPKLKSLTINRIQPQGIEFVIDTPMLEHLEIDGFIGYWSFVDYPSKLTKAELCIWDLMWWERRNADMFSQSQILPLLSRISGVEFISLGCVLRFFEVLDYLDVDVGSIFYNVTHLKLIYPSNHDMNYSFNVRNPIPLCLLSKLKSLEISKMEGNNIEVKMLEYILRRANVLERLYLSPIHKFSYYFNDEFDDPEFVDCKKDQLWWEYRIYNTLLAVPKSSLLSKIKFIGNFICVSSDMSQNELIVTLKNQNSATLPESIW